MFEVCRHDHFTAKRPVLKSVLYTGASLHAWYFEAVSYCSVVITEFDDSFPFNSDRTFWHLIFLGNFVFMACE